MTQKRNPDGDRNRFFENLEIQVLSHPQKMAGMQMSKAALNKVNEREATVA